MLFETAASIVAPSEGEDSKEAGSEPASVEEAKVIDIDESIWGLRETTSESKDFTNKQQVCVVMVSQIGFGSHSL